tara:strand:+ start:122 stop:313 length:192 start_codon:yes stop_codon:yes gene_type:complete
MKLVCRDCGGDEVQIMAWVDINTKRFIDDPNSHNAWCDDCCRETSPVSELKYSEMKNKNPNKK